MDPLSVGASVAGLLSAAGQVSNIVGKIIASKRGGSREINDIKTSVDTLHSVLVQIQLLLFDRGTLDPHRASMILVDQVKATLTECVLTFSELDGCVRGLEADEKLGILDSIRWALKAPALKRHLQKLEVHKTSLTLMMSILTCRSTYHAETSASELKDLVVRVLESNQALAERMSTIETTRAMSSMTRIREETSSFMIQKTVRDHILTQGKPIAEDACTNYTNIRFTFEDDLNTSWVYKRSVSRGPSAFSIATSTKLTQSWSLLSGLSLSNISNIAVQCLPIYEHDLQNRKLYRFGEVGEGLISNPQFNPAGREPQPIFRRFFVPPTYTRHITSRRNFGAFRVKNPRPYRAFARYTLDLAEQLLSPAVIADLTQPDPASILFSAVSICYSDVSDCGPRSVKNSFTLHAPWLAYHIGEVFDIFMVFVHNDCEYWISKRRGRGRDRDIYSSQFVWIAGCDFIAIESTDADDQEFVSRLTVGVEKRRAATIEEAPAKLLHGERKIQKAKLEEGNAKYSQAAASLGSRSHILNVVPSYEQVGELRVKQNTEQEERDAIVVRRQTALRVAEEEDARRAQQEKQDAITVDKQTAIKRGEEEKLKVQREERSAKKSRQVAKKRAKAEEYVKAQQDEHYREKMRVQTAWRDRKQANKQEKKERLKERLKEQKKERSKEQKKERSKEKTKEKTKENIVHGEAARHSLKLPRVWVSWLILFSSIAPYVVQILLWIPWNFLCISFVALSYYALLPFLLIVCLNILISPLLHVDSHVHSEVLCHLLWARIEFIGIEMLMLVMGLGYGALQAHEYYPGHQSLGDTQPIFCGY